LETVAKQYAAEIQESHIDPIILNFDECRQLPPDIDRPLLGKAKTQIGMLDPAEKRQLRDAFVSALRERKHGPTDG
jgi:hypothetical protein